MKRLLILILLIGTSICYGQSNSKLVNMFWGSAGDHGQMTPGATVPFGMISVCPDSTPKQHGGYDYNVPEISGVSINRISGVGCYGTGGNISVRTALPDKKLSIVKGTEVAYPGYYETMFSNGVKGKFTATNNVALERYTFPKEVDKILAVDFSASIDKRKEEWVTFDYKVVSNNMIEGFVRAPTACARGRYTLYYSFFTSEPFEWQGEVNGHAILKFNDNVKDIEVRIAVSPVDNYCANELIKNLKTTKFKKIHKRAVKAWDNILNRIKVKGSTKDQRHIFYSALYRVYLSPMNVTSLDGRYKGTDGKIYTADNFTYYSSWCMWDAFRAKFPLLVITSPKEMEDICRSLLEQYRTGIESWATMNESVPTVRTEHSQIMLLDSYLKGIDTHSLKYGYEGMKKDAKKLPLKSDDQKLESSYDLWAISKIAEILEEKEDSEYFRNYADSLFYAVWPSGFQYIDESFAKMKDNGLYQGSRWQYRWSAPHFIDKMIELHGKDKLREELTYFFENNLLNQGNEPGIHTPFIFNFLDAPEKTQETIRNLLTKEDMIHLYGGNAEYPEPFIGRAFQNKVDGLAPEMDEDDGTMSAWYIFSSMGFYPVIVGTDTYEMFSPLYDKITINNGQVKITIETKGRKKEDDIIKSIEVDGIPIDGYTLKHDVFRKNSKIIIKY